VNGFSNAKKKYLMFEKLEAIEKTYEELTAQMTDNEVISDQSRYTKIAKQHRELEAIVVKFREIKKLDSDIEGNREILRDMDDAEMRELQKAEALIEGDRVYSRLKYESGGHRVQRVPQTETSGRIHTSAVTVAVLPEAEEVDVKIDPKDIRVDTFCSSGPGGQSVNTTYSAVRLTHMPSGLVVSMQDEKSQIKNREKAMRVLRSRLYEIEQQKQHDALAKERRDQVGTGDRSEKIRTYNFKENRVTDHRIGLTIHQLDLIMEGSLDELIEATITHFQAEKLKAETEKQVAKA
jgi:peptide chain release factor 1